MPGSSWTRRLNDSSSRGLRTSFRYAATSLMWACSKNRMPLVMLNGMLRRVSSSCSSSAWKCERYSTAILFRSAPSSRNSSTRWATNAACSEASLQATSTGFAPALRAGASCLANWCTFAAMAALATFRISGVLR